MKRAGENAILSPPFNLAPASAGCRGYGAFATMTKEEERELRANLARLLQEHRDLDAAIGALQNTPGADVSLPKHSGLPSRSFPSCRVCGGFLESVKTIFTLTAGFDKP